MQIGNAHDPFSRPVNYADRWQSVKPWANYFARVKEKKKGERGGNVERSNRRERKKKREKKGKSR